VSESGKMTLSTKVDAGIHEEFARRAREMGLSSSALLRRLVLEFLGKPVVGPDRVLKLEKEVEVLKSEVLEIRSRIDVLNRRLLFLEKKIGSIRRS